MLLLYPPIISRPVLISVAVCPSRALFRMPALAKVPVEVLYTSTELKSPLLFSPPVIATLEPMVVAVWK